MSKELAKQILHIVDQSPNSPAIEQFIDRVKLDHRLTRDENPHTHFCVYFAAYDSALGEIFVGHHMKSGLWLFNGGHIDKDETVDQALAREIREEWGIEIKPDQIGSPQLLTVTGINNPARQKCTEHFDIWYFIPVDRDEFRPDPELLATEFYRTQWLTPGNARELVTDPSTLQALTQFEKMFQEANS